ncbi:MAG: hypothetical protein U5L72_10550 [Bacteroidales bacterium]|nr:hypothetical protein [Bacteroidales bacterium]
MPEHLEIDITNIEIGQSVKIGDLSYDKLEVIDNKRAMIVSVEVSRVSIKDEEAAAVPAAEAPEAEAPAEE